MTTRGYIIALSLAGSVAVAGCWMFTGKMGDPPAAKTKIARVPSRFVAKPVPSGPENSPPRPAADTAQVLPAGAANALSLTQKELADRAAKVEQEANHDLRRLVRLLDLNEEQQDRVFQTLVERSPSWSRGGQMATGADGSVTAAGKRTGEAVAAGGTVTAPGTYSKKPAAAAETPAVSGSSAPAATVTGTDSMSEILALLDPGQQDVLVKEEMDRAAWWAEILPQITPPDDVPALDGTPSPAAGQTKTYEGAEVLE